MPLISLRNIRLAFGGAPLLDNVALQIDKGERICLLGRNGAGKSTLLKLIAGTLTPDAGDVDRQQGLRVATLPQDVPRDLSGTIFNAVACGLGLAGELLGRWHTLNCGLMNGDEGLLPELLEIQHAVDAADAWPLQQGIEQALSRLGLDPQAAVEGLSGGLLRRVLLARVLATAPDILLLDEPTNHLDVAAIVWLEEHLKREKCTLVFVTHDRAFLRSLATRIVELDRGRLFDFACDYDTFLLNKDGLLHNEEQEWKRFDKKLAEEEVWIRKGIKARRTRNEGRVRALKQMREERRQRRDRTGSVKLQLHEAERSGRLVVEAKHVDFAWGDTPILNGFSTSVMRGDRIGIIGPNGVGKTTLLKLLLGQLQPQSGTIRLGTNLQVLYFDQLREQLDMDKTVQQNLSGDQDMVLVGGQLRHVYGYLQDFLFTPDRARTPVRILSGGERHRLLLARLFTREANVLVLDEPTNDLDLETLDLLEELIADYAGTLFLVSHDRDFLNRVVTDVIAFEEDGRVAEYVGGYDDWLRQRPQATKVLPVAEAASRPAREQKRKLGFKEKKELEGLPGRIEALEAEQAQLQEQLADPQLYRQGGEKVVALKARMESLGNELATVYARWQELEALASD